MYQNNRTSRYAQDAANRLANIIIQGGNQLFRLVPENWIISDNNENNPRYRLRNDTDHDEL